MEDSTSTSSEPAHSSSSPPSPSGSMAYSSSAAPRTESFTPTAGMSQAQQAPLLPPIQHFENHQAMQSQPPPYGAPLMSNGAPMQQQQHPPPPYPPPQFPQYQNGALPTAQLPPVADGQNVLRYPLPPQAPMDARSISAGRHKKEIKRRTKTGCLTCRKRRIKCDEGHPTCRNCAKSKRECMGYDPIFKQQPGPANIQPAPAGGNPPPPQQPHNSAVNPAVPQNPYQHPSQSYQGSAGAFAPAGVGHANEPHYTEYSSSTSLDPALAGGDHPAHMAHNNYPALQPQRRVKHLAIEELFSLNDIPPRYNMKEAPPPVSPATQSEIETFYKYHYAIGLDRLFETTWYSSRGLAHLQHDNYLQDFVAQCAEQFKAKKNDEPTSRPLLSLEARLVWSLAQMPRATAGAANGAGVDPLVKELLPRIDTVENLLTGQFLEPTRVPPPPQSSQEPTQDTAMANQKYNERAFWHHLARFTSIRDDKPVAMKDVGDTLLSIRSILNMLENRDVLYSIAIARHIGGRMADFHPQRHLVASTNDPNDDVNKLKVAQQFVEGEDQRGTTQVIQRICSMAIRGWILQKQ